MLLTTRTAWPASHRSFDRRFDRTFAQLANLAFGGASVEGTFGPRVAATWNDGAYVLTLDVPGIPEEALSVSVTGRILVLDVNTDELTWNQRIRLPQTVDVESTSATYANGRLTVTVPVAPEAQPRKVEITVAAPAAELESGTDQSASPSTDSE
jgi:HSP20 family molecular chaperone IbpA